MAMVPKESPRATTTHLGCGPLEPQGHIHPIGLSTPRSPPGRGTLKKCHVTQSHSPMTPMGPWPLPGTAPAPGDHARSPWPRAPGHPPHSGAIPTPHSPPHTPPGRRHVRSCRGHVQAQGARGRGLTLSMVTRAAASPPPFPSLSSTRVHPPRTPPRGCNPRASSIIQPGGLAPRPGMRGCSQPLVPGEEGGGGGTSGAPWGVSLPPPPPMRHGEGGTPPHPPTHGGVGRRCSAPPPSPGAPCRRAPPTRVPSVTPPRRGLTQLGAEVTGSRASFFFRYPPSQYQTHPPSPLSTRSGCIARGYPTIPAVPTRGATRVLSATHGCPTQCDGRGVGSWGGTGYPVGRGAPPRRAVHTGAAQAGSWGHPCPRSGTGHPEGPAAPPRRAGGPGVAPCTPWVPWDAPGLHPHPGLCNPGVTPGSPWVPGHPHGGRGGPRAAPSTPWVTGHPHLGPGWHRASRGVVGHPHAELRTPEPHRAARGSRGGGGEHAGVPRGCAPTRGCAPQGSPGLPTHPGAPTPRAAAGTPGSPGRPTPGPRSAGWHPGLHPPGSPDARGPPRPPPRLPWGRSRAVGGRMAGRPLRRCPLPGGSWPVPGGLLAPFAPAAPPGAAAAAAPGHGTGGLRARVELGLGSARHCPRRRWG